MLPAKSVYASPILPFVIAVTSFSAVIAGFQSTRIAVAQRNFNQKRLVQTELFAQVAGVDRHGRDRRAEPLDLGAGRRRTGGIADDDDAQPHLAERASEPLARGEDERCGT